MNTVTLNYTGPKGDKYTFVFDDSGDLVNFYKSDRDLSDDGGAIVKALTELDGAGHDIQRDISDAFFRKDEHLS